jgi:hypothetical protein
MTVEVKLIEVRDSGTLIVALCVDMNPENDAQRYYLRRYGYPCDGAPNVVVTHANANGDPATNDPYSWKSRTWGVAHNHIIEHWDELDDGSVVDVEFILGNSLTPKVSERLS